METMITITPEQEYATVKERPTPRVGQIVKPDEISEGQQLLGMIGNREVRTIRVRNKPRVFLGETKVDATMNTGGSVDFIDLISLSDWGVTENRNGLWSKHRWLKNPHKRE